MLLRTNANDKNSPAETNIPPLIPAGAAHAARFSYISLMTVVATRELGALHKQVGQQVGDALMHAFRNVRFLRRIKQIEGSQLAPLAHHGKPIEHWNFMLQRTKTHHINIRLDFDHRFRARAVLRVHQDNVAVRVQHGCHTLVDR